METIVVVGFPIISKLVRGQTVQLSNCALIPDDQLFNESKNMDCCVQFKEPTAEERGVSALQSGEAPSQQLQAAIALVSKAATSEFAGDERYLAFIAVLDELEQRAAV